MIYNVLGTGTRLELIAEQEDIDFLKEAQADENVNFHSHEVLRDLFEKLLANSELDWVDPQDTGDLTEAPMLGIYGPDQPRPDNPSAIRGQWLNHVGCWDHGGKHRQMYAPIYRRWAWMDYQVKSLQEALLEDGKAILVGGHGPHKPPPASQEDLCAYVAEALERLSQKLHDLGVRVAATPSDAPIPAWICHVRLDDGLGMALDLLDDDGNRMTVSLSDAADRETLAEEA